MCGVYRVYRVYVYVCMLICKHIYKKGVKSLMLCGFYAKKILKNQTFFKKTIDIFTLAWYNIYRK